MFGAHAPAAASSSSACAPRRSRSPTATTRAPIAEGRNRVTGRIVDSSFIGVSTQYLVDSPAGKGLAVYEQNVDRRAGLVPGAEVVLHWNPAHTFGLDAAQAIDAGVEKVEDAA